MKIKIPYYKKGKNAVWAAIQFSTINEKAIPQKREFIKQFYIESGSSPRLSQIFGNKRSFNKMLSYKKSSGFRLAGECLVDTNTGAIERLM